MDKIIRTAESDPKSVVLVIADIARSDPPMSTAFVSELVRRLQGQGPAATLLLTWIEHRLAESNQTIDQMVQLGNQQQAADQVSVSNSINSLRTLGAIDWREFIESISVVEQTMRNDPAGIYGGMDFASRDRYRHVVERIARASPISEAQVARMAIQMAGDAGATGKENGNNEEGNPIRAHVGFYLIDDGMPELELAAQVRLSLKEKIQHAARGKPLLFYLGAIAMITLGLVSGSVAESICRWSGGIGAGCGWNPVSFGDEPACRGFGELGGPFSGKAPPVGAHGFFWRHTFPVPYAGSDPHSADQRTGD